MKQRVITKWLLSIISFYQKFISPQTKSHCRFYPSCSQYSKEAIIRYGAKKGTLLSIWRILRCQPFSKGGIDLP